MLITIPGTYAALGVNVISFSITHLLSHILLQAYIKFNGYNLKVFYHCHFVFVSLQSSRKKGECIAAYCFRT